MSNQMEIVTVIGAMSVIETARSVLAKQPCRIIATRVENLLGGQRRYSAVLERAHEPSWAARRILAAAPGAIVEARPITELEHAQIKRAGIAPRA